MKRPALQKKLHGKGLKIGVVTALFNPEVTLLLEKGAFEALQRAEVNTKNITAVRVPGAFEIPLAVKALFQKKKVDAVVALGAVIRGETGHYDHVCRSVERGCSQVSLEFQKPVGFGVLTTENEQQALERAGGRHGNKGRDAAEAAVQMCELLKSL